MAPILGDLVIHQKEFICLRDWVVLWFWGLKITWHLNQVGFIAKFEKSTQPSLALHLSFQTRAAGAPAIAKASGAYVPGVPIRNLGSMGAKSFDELKTDGDEGSKKEVGGNGSLPCTKTDSSDLKTPPVESQWRLETSPPAGMKKPSKHLPDSSPAPEMPNIPAGYSPSSRKSSEPISVKQKYDKYYHACHSFKWDTKQFFGTQNKYGDMHEAY